MSDISSQLIKDSYNYVLQSDLNTGVVYRIGGGIPINPIFQSGLTINSGFTYSNGSEQSGYVLTSDDFGNATWGPISGSSSGSFLPLSGGTVTGPTIFTGGLTANTISATTYFNLPVSGLTSGTGIDISYFGLFLIYVGYFKVELYSWVFFLVWMFILIEFTNLGKIFYKHIYKRYILKKNFYNFLNFRTSKN